MGYQEFTFKLDQPQQFMEQKKSIDKYMNKKELSAVCEYTLIEVKQPIGEMNEGMYLYVTGERHGGKELVRYLNTKLESSYNSDIETCLGMWISNKDHYEKDSIKLTKLFKEKRSDIGNVLMSGPPELKRELER